MKITFAPELEPGQTFVVDRFRPEDALGVAQLFMAVYGPSYPVDSYYDPEWLVAANERGDVNSVVARTPTGDIVAHGALYRSSPPNPRLLEYGQMIVRMNYRRTFAAFKIHKYLHGVLMPSLAPDGMFGETVTNRMETQKLSAVAKCVPMAFELDLMPGEAYEVENSARGRVSCATFFFPWRDAPQTICVPRRYKETVAFLLADSGLQRTLRVDEVRPEAPTRMEGRTFAAAGVTRVNVFHAGVDFPEVIQAWEREARAQGVLVHQIFLSMAEPESAWAAEWLHNHGYFLGGLMPWWFGGDGLLMQKVESETDYEGIHLYIPKTRSLLERIRAEREAQAAGETPSGL